MPSTYRSRRFRHLNRLSYAYAATSLSYQGSQWRSKALRNLGSTVTWGPSLSLPSTSPSLPFCPLPHPLPLPRSGPQFQLRGLGERCKLPPAGSGAEPQPKSNLVHFSLKICHFLCHLVATILMIFLRVLPKNFLWPHYSGGGGRSSGPRFIEPPESPVPTPLQGSLTNII